MTLAELLNSPIRFWVAFLCVVIQAIAFILLIYAAQWTADTIGF